MFMATFDSTYIQTSCYASSLLAQPIHSLSEDQGWTLWCSTSGSEAPAAQSSVLGSSSILLLPLGRQQVTAGGLGCSQPSPANLRHLDCESRRDTFYQQGTAGGLGCSRPSPANLGHLDCESRREALSTGLAHPLCPTPRLLCFSNEHKNKTFKIKKPALWNSG